jgi:hypothetical protein
LPSSIRGYKVRDAKVKIVTSTEKAAEKAANSAFVRLGEPELVDIGFYGATIEVGAEITAGEQTGRVDFLTFRDFRIGGVPVEIDEYDHPFQFKKNQVVAIPKPIRLSLSMFSVPKAVYHELTEQTDELDVTGTVFVFGKFKKMGFEFKRVVPVRIDMKIKNPLRQT